jgi:hypothetical protein
MKSRKASKMLPGGVSKKEKGFHLTGLSE